MSDRSVLPYVDRVGVVLGLVEVRSRPRALRGERRRVGLSSRQREALGVLRGYVVEHQKAPTLRELGALLKVSEGSVWEILKALESHGAIRREKGKRRAIEIVEKGGSS